MIGVSLGISGLAHAQGFDVLSLSPALWLDA